MNENKQETQHTKQQQMHHAPGNNSEYGLTAFIKKICPAT